MFIAARHYEQTSLDEGVLHRQDALSLSPALGRPVFLP